MESPNGSNDATHTPPPLSFYNTFKNLAIFSISQQAVSADITKNSAVDTIMQYLNHEYWNNHIYSTQKGFEECVREELPI
jgi:hypothetical protein